MHPIYDDNKEVKMAQTTNLFHRRTDTFQRFPQDQTPMRNLMMHQKTPLV